VLSFILSKQKATRVSTKKGRESQDLSDIILSICAWFSFILSILVIPGLEIQLKRKVSKSIL
jgi:2-phospho-L-lactate transferase/gluconeogenesis factor (CofD/UPF0052 family)